MFSYNTYSVKYDYLVGHCQFYCGQQSLPDLLLCHIFLIQDEHIHNSERKSKHQYMYFIIQYKRALT